MEVEEGDGVAQVLGFRGRARDDVAARGDGMVEAPPREESGGGEGGGSGVESGHVKFSFEFFPGLG